jgi:hypothetical protein
MITGSCWNICEKCGEGYNAPLSHTCQFMKPLKCNKHPKYKAIRMPRCQCTTCWDMWDIKHRFLTKKKNVV